MLRVALDGSHRRRIYLFRHGDVSYVDDHGNRVGNTKTVALTDWGREQARRTGEALAKIPFDRAICSPFPRAVETAELILSGRNIAIEQKDAFREVEGDEMFRSKITDINEFAYSFRDAALPGARYAGGDTFESVHGRLAEALELLVPERNWETLALVAHGGVNRMMLAWALGTDLTCVPAIDQNTCCFNILDIDTNIETGQVVRKLVRAMNVTVYDVAKEGNHLLSMEQIAERMMRKKENA